MKYSITATISTLALVLALAAPSRAGCPVGYKEYTGADGGDWRDDGNWTPANKPDSSDDVCIPNDLTVFIWAGECTTGANIGDPCDPTAPGPECGVGETCADQSYAAAACRNLEVQASGNPPDDISIIYLTSKADLVVNGAATVDGLIQTYVDTTLEFKSTLTVNDGGLAQSGNDSTIVLHDEVTLDGGAIGAWNNGGAIKLAADITITGDGGEIKTKEPYTPFALIESGTGTGSPYTLTLAGVNNASPATSLTFHGNWDVRVPVENNAFVLADDDVLAFHNAPITGTGMWDAGKLNTTPGTLVINVEVSGGGAWCLDDDPSGKITFNANSTALTSDFNLDTGTLEIKANVTTTGNLDMVSVSSSVPKITVDSGKKIIFSN